MGLKRLTQRIGLTPMVFAMMIKGALPPTIAMAMYRSQSVANVYGNFGFLIIVTSILAMPLQPRARFQQNIALSTILTCFAAAIALLSHFSGLRARNHTQTQIETYNASASAVNAIFLCLVVWLVSSFRAAWPQFNIPFLLCTIFSMVAITFGPTVLTEHNSLVLVRQLLLSFLTGYGISIAVSLIWFPTTSRSVFLAGSKGFLDSCEKLLREERCLFGCVMSKKGDEAVRKKQLALKSALLKGLAMEMLGSMARLREELEYAKQEIALGVYTGDDLGELLRCLEGLMIPILGLSKILSLSGLGLERALQELDVGKEKMAILLGTNGYYATRRSQSSAKDDNNMLEITEKPTDRKEVTTPELSCLPEDPKDNKVYSQSLENWDPSTQKASQQQLYIQCLLDSVSKTGCDLATFSESKFVDGRKRGRRLILPWNITKSWLPSRSTIPTNLDPEHLPPAISSQRLGNITRIILARLPSDSSKFGLRVVAATMSIGIMAFLRNTQHFFVEYRIVWAMVMIPISMSPTAGTAIYGYIGRALGVAAAMALTYVNWYIVDGKPAGVIVVFFVCMMGYYFLLLKFPRFVVLFVLAAVNHVLIIGYELQVSIVTIRKATVSGQRFFPLYTLAPYRLLCVLAGLFAAFIWTIFPTQISEHKILRQKVGRSLTLLAQYSASVSATIDQRLRDSEGDGNLSSSPGRILKARRYQILFEELALLTEMRQISGMVPWEISIGGQFPKNAYDKLIDEIQSSVASLSVMAYISQTFPGGRSLPSHSFIYEAYAASHFNPTSNKVTTVLSLLASAVVSGTPLVQGLEAPPHNERLDNLLGSAVELFGDAALGDPMVEAFVVVEVAGEELLETLGAMIEIVKELVGEMDFANIV